MNVTKLQDQNEGASAMYSLLKVHQEIGTKGDFFDKAWALSLEVMAVQQRRVIVSLQARTLSAFSRKANM